MMDLIYLGLMVLGAVTLFAGIGLMAVAMTLMGLRSLINRKAKKK